MQSHTSSSKNKLAEMTFPSELEITLIRRLVSGVKSEEQNRDQDVEVGLGETGGGEGCGYGCWRRCVGQEIYLMASPPCD